MEVFTVMPKTRILQDCAASEETQSALQAYAQQTDRQTDRQAARQTETLTEGTDLTNIVRC